MDVLAVNRAGASASGGAPAHVAVAPCGTALTTQQVRLLDTVTGGLAARGVVTAFDGDGPGRQASLRAYDLLREIRAWPTVLDLPAGQDPASLAAEHGPATLHAALLTAAGKPLADLVVDDRIARHQLRWPEGQVAAGRDAAAVVAAMPPEHVSRQIARVSAHTGLDVRTVSDLVVDAVSSPSRTRSSGGAAETGPPLARPHGAATARAGPVAGPVAGRQAAPRPGRWPERVRALRSGRGPASRAAAREPAPSGATRTADQSPGQPVTGPAAPLPHRLTAHGRAPRTRRGSAARAHHDYRRDR
jgi:DNA primase